MSDTIQVSFGPPRYAVQIFVFPKESGEFVVPVPEGSQFLGADAPAHDPKNVHVSWAVIQKDNEIIDQKFRICFEGEEFGAEEEVDLFQIDENTVLESRAPGFFPIATWVDTTEVDGVLTYRRGFVVGYEELDEPDGKDGEGKGSEEP